MLEMKLYDLYYSEKQKEMCEEVRKRNGWIYSIPSVIGPNGEKIEYTECVESGEKPCGKWDDYRFVGKAEILA